METTHLIKGKTVCMQLVMFIIGLEGIFFNVLSQLGLFPCVEPFNFNSNRKGNSLVFVPNFFKNIVNKSYQHFSNQQLRCNHSMLFVGLPNAEILQVR